MYGVPQYIICGNGRQLVSKQIQNLVQQYNSKLWYIAGYHAQANFLERYNKTVCTAIRSYIKTNHKLWDTKIPKIVYTLRTAVSEVTGYSPAFLNFGRIISSFGNYYRNLPNNDLATGSVKDCSKQITRGAPEKYSLL